MALTLKLPIPSLIKRDIDNVSLTVLFILCPLLSLPWVIKKSYNGEKYSQFLLSFFMGLICILAWPPQGDLFRHYMVYYQLKGKTLEYLFDYYSNGDYLLRLSQFFAGKLNLGFEIVRLITVALSYYMLLTLYSDLKNQSGYNTHRIVLFVVILLSVPFIYILRGIRYGFSMMIISYFILKRFILCHKQKKDFLFLPLALITHFGSLWIIIICLISPIIPNRVPRLVPMSVMILAYLISTFSADLIQMLPIDFIGQRAIEMYSTGGASKNHLIGLNFFGLLTEKSLELMIILYIIITIRYLPYNKETKILYLNIIFWFFTLSLFEINRRVGIPIYIMGGVITFKYIVFKKYIRNLILTTLIATSLLVGISYWRMYLISNIAYIIAPLPVSIIQGYDYEWIEKNVDGMGALKIYRN